VEHGATENEMRTYTNPNYIRTNKDEGGGGKAGAHGLDARHSATRDPTVGRPVHRDRLDRLAHLAHRDLAAAFPSG